MRRLLLTLPALAAVAVLLAACGGGGGSTTGNASASHALTVTTAGTQFGTVLTGAGHRTVYLFRKDAPGMSSCSGACASLWPPVTTAGHALAGGGTAAQRLGVLTRSDGTKQVTYAGHALYYYAGDQQRGEVSGQALDQFGAPWFVVAPSGAAVTR